MKNVDVLVTGAAGVLGREIVLALRGGGYTVAASGRTSADGLDTRWDISVENQPTPICSPQVVVHAAARRGPFQQPLRETGPLFDANVTGTMRVAQWCVAQHVPRLVLISGALVYGEWAVARSEEDLPQPWLAGPYAVSKWCAEGVASLVKGSGVGLSILRLSSLYGSGYDGGLVQRLLREGRDTGVIKLSPPFDDAFDLLHVSDAARAVQSAVESEHGGVLNVGSGVATSIEQLVELCSVQVGAKVEASSAPSTRPGRTFNWVDVSRARTLLQFAPKVSLEEGVAEVIGRLDPG